MKWLSRHKLNIRKPVKIGKLRRRIKTAEKRLDRRQQSRASIIPVVDDTQRTCSNCGTTYVGRVCPQCGQAGTWTRYTWHQAMLNFLDIWGLGNRPIFRTLKELSWRPGYMVRDYLNGHRNFYFPPFKLLAIMVVFLFLTSQLTHENQFSFFETMSRLEKLDSAYHVGESFRKLEVNKADQAPPGESVSQAEVEVKKADKDDDGLDLSYTSYRKTIVTTLVRFSKFMAGNMLYEWLFIAAFVGICIWITFRHVSRYTLVETYIFYVFLLSMVLLWRIPKLLCSGVINVFDGPAEPVMSGTDISFLGFCAAVLVIIFTVIKYVIGAYSWFLEFLSFRQFYQMSWGSVIKYAVRLPVVGSMVALWFISLLAAAFLVEESVYVGLFIYIMLLLPVTFVVAELFFNRHQAHVTAAAIRLSKTAILMSLIINCTLAFIMYDQNFNITWSYVLLTLSYVAATAFSLLPIVLYKRFHNAWIASLPTVILTLVAGYILAT
ncbi:MAG: DUF3667 domain-containing protein [Muribaculaceae bacterium]|nr:DUF3667 domain-containing protein [Muribaculaceae bacterium]